MIRTVGCGVGVLLMAGVTAFMARAGSPPVEVFAPHQTVSFLDSQVARQDHTVIGRTVNVLIEHGELHAAILDLVGFMNVGDRTVVMPWAVLRFEPADKPVKITVDLTPEQISALAKAKLSGASSPQGAGTPDPPAASRKDGLKLIDATVDGTAGKALGRITDLLIDPTGQPRAVIVAVGGALDPAGREIAVAWLDLHFRQTQGKIRIVADLTDQQVKAARDFKDGQPAYAVLPKPGSASYNDQPVAATK